MSKILFFSAIIVTCLSISTGSLADSHATTSQTENATNHQRREIITIQVSSLKKADDANREKSRLISRGLDAFVDYEKVKDKGMWYRVYVGQFETRKAANAFAEDLVQQGIIEWYWVKKKTITLDATKSETEAQDKPVIATATVEKPKNKITVASSETSSQTSPSTIAEETEPSQLSPAKKTQPPESKKKVTKIAEPKETHAVGENQADRAKQDPFRLSLGVKTSVLASHKTGDFKVTNSNSGDSWSFGDTFLFFGIVGNYRLNELFTIESSLDKDFMQNIENWLLTVAVKYQLQPFKWVTPYLRGGGIIGSLQWDDMPGDFDTGMGLEGGLGMHHTKSRFRWGLEASYRYMKYNYNPPGTDDITFTEDHLNMSGLVLSGYLSYLF